MISWFGGTQAVVDLQWDPLSNNYLLVAYADGIMALVDAEAAKVVHEFDPAPLGGGMTHATFLSIWLLQYVCPSHIVWRGLSLVE